MSKKWTPEEDAAFLTMLDAKLTIQQIVMLTGRSESAVNVRKWMFRPTGRKCAAAPIHRAIVVADPIPADEMTYGQETLSVNMIASRLYLEDLTNAGHKPGTGELKIAPDAISPMRMAVPLHDRSFTGSISAMCADNAGRGY